MNQSDIEQVTEILRNAQLELEKHGFVSLIAPSAMPQGYSLSLIVGQSEQAIISQYTACTCGEEQGLVADEATRKDFHARIAENLASRAIDLAAGRP